MCVLHVCDWVGQGDVLLVKIPEILNKKSIIESHEACVPIQFSPEVTMGLAKFIVCILKGPLGLRICTAPRRRVWFQWPEN